MSTVALLRGLVDDAAVFPPGDVPLAQAVPAHRAHRRADYGRSVGPLLLPVAAAEGARDLLADGERLPVALVLRPGAGLTGLVGALAVLTEANRATITGVELPVTEVAALPPDLDPALPRWLEVRRDRIEPDLDVVLAAGAHAKLRTGGLAAQDVPSDLELARFVSGACQRGLRFKLTAGLHHAVRSTSVNSTAVNSTAVNSTAALGVDQHGVANVLLATALALRGEAPSVLRTTLGERDGPVLADALRGLTDTEVDAVRAAFASFGCCAVTDPLTELANLGLQTR